jgi:hypothetical protein
MYDQNFADDFSSYDPINPPLEEKDAFEKDIDAFTDYQKTRELKQMIAYLKELDMYDAYLQWRDLPF